MLCELLGIFAFEFEKQKIPFNLISPLVKSEHDCLLETTVRSTKFLDCTDSLGSFAEPPGEDSGPAAQAGDHRDDQKCVLE